MITLTQVKQELTLKGNDYNDLLAWLITSVESVWDQMTNKVWASTTHNETFSGDGSKCLFVSSPGLTDVTYISVGETDVISVNNTSDNAIASVSVLSTGVKLTLNGSATTLLFADYATMTLLSAAITALGNGWASSVYSEQGGWASSNLLEFMGRNCANNLIDLSIPYEYLEDIYVNADTGEITSYGFVPGINNIRVKYTAGYTVDTCPAWLKQTLIRQVSHWYMQASEKRWHVSSMSLGDGGTISYTQEGMKDEINLLPDFKNMAGMHRKINV